MAKKGNRLLSAMKYMMVLTIGVLLVSAYTAPAIAGGSFLRFGKKVKVMTRNLYVGANLFDVLSVPIDEIPIAVANLVEGVVETNFPERAEALVDEIERFRPHLIGLQEVSLIRTQSPSDFFIGNPEAASVELFDYLSILLDALEARGLSYEEVATSENADVELPMFAGLDENGAPLFDDARLTDRDVILKRRSVATSNPSNRNYSKNFKVDIGDEDDEGVVMTIEFTRGFVAVDATVRGRTYRFVNTHLEVQREGENFQALQAEELIGELSGETLPIILVGDFNSSPEDPDSQPYGLFTDAGYVDVWERRLFGRSKSVFTCCQASDLLNEDSMLDERVDLIFVRNDMGFLPFTIVGPVFAFVVGDETEDKTPSGLWPSDHAGVVSTLRIPSLSH